MISARNARRAQYREETCSLRRLVAVISQDIPLDRCQIGSADHVSARDSRRKIRGPDFGVGPDCVALLQTL
jgi:hypothetical protein